MNKNKGISLVVLTITIIVMIILASVVIFVSADTLNNSKKAAFASDLEVIEDLVDEYYLNNNELPIIDTTSYDKTSVVALITTASDVLSEEISSNLDDTSLFYEIDLSKLPIDESKRGTREGGDTKDIYLVATNNFNVYYLKGEKIAGEYYFSLTEKLTGKTKINNSESTDTSSVTITNKTSSIKLTKSTKEWTNKLTVNIKTTLEEGESLAYHIANEEVYYLQSSEEANLNITDFVGAIEHFTNKFYSDEANQVVKVIKYKDYDTVNHTGEILAVASINISNLDVLSGANITSSNISYTKYDNFILASVSGYTDLGGSGVKEARVLYTKKTESDGTTSPYYDNLPATITSEYVKNNGKSSDPTTIKLPLDVKEYALVFIDNAGNISNIVTCETKTVVVKEIAIWNTDAPTEICRISYEEGMTWAKWCDSEYNTEGWYVNNNTIYSDTSLGSGKITGVTTVNPTDVIDENKTYYGMGNNIVYRTGL